MTNTAYSLYTIWAYPIIWPYTVIRGTGRQSIASIVFLCTRILPFLVSICLFPICVLDLWKTPVILLSYDTYPRFRDTGSILNSWIWYCLLKIEGFCHLPIVVSATKNVCCGVRKWTSLVGKFEKKIFWLENLLCGLSSNCFSLQYRFVGIQFQWPRIMHILFIALLGIASFAGHWLGKMLTMTTVKNIML